MGSHHIVPICLVVIALAALLGIHFLEKLPRFKFEVWLNKKVPGLDRYNFILVLLFISLIGIQFYWSLYLQEFSSFDFFAIFEISLALLGLYGAYITVIQFIVSMSGDESNEDRYLGKSRALVIIEQNAYISLTRKSSFSFLLLVQLTLPFVLLYLKNNFDIEVNKLFHFILLFWQTSAAILALIFMLIVIVNIELPITALFMTEKQEANHSLTKSIELSVLQDFIRLFQRAYKEESDESYEKLKDSMLFTLKKMSESDKDEYFELVYYGLTGRSSEQINQKKLMSLRKFLLLELEKITIESFIVSAGRMILYLNKMIY